MNSRPMHWIAQIALIPFFAFHLAGAGSAHLQAPLGGESAEIVEASVPSGELAGPAVTAWALRQDPAPKDNESSTNGGPRGRVVERGTERPVEGLTVQMKFGVLVVAETVTGKDGSFVLPKPERKRRSIVVLTEDWHITPSKLRLDEDQSAGLSELVFEAERIVSAPMRGRIVDSRTGEGVPDFLVRVEGPFVKDRENGKRSSTAPFTYSITGSPRRDESIVTQADGRFESVGEFERGELELNLVDHSFFRASGRIIISDSSRKPRHLHTWEDGEMPVEAVFKVHVGPTYPLRLALPSGMDVEDFFATFLSPMRGARELHQSLVADTGSMESFLARGLLELGTHDPEAPLRIGDTIWTRFQEPVLPHLNLKGPKKESLLHIRSENGHWEGKASVDGFKGIYPEVIPIALEPRGSVEGAVRDESGNAVRTAWLQLFSKDGGAEPLREVGAAGRGHFEFKWLAAGDYELVVPTNRYEEWRQTVTIESGSTETLDVRLATDGELGRISGVLRSRTGEYRSRTCSLTLQGIDRPALKEFKLVHFQRQDGEYSAPFAFKDLPRGEYKVTLSTDDNSHWESRVIKVTAPTDELEFLCLDDSPTFRLSLSAVDAQTGAPVKNSWGIVWLGDPMDNVRLTNGNNGEGVYGSVPEGVPLHWAIRARGYRLATGDESSIQESDRWPIIEAKLQRGWGKIFKVTTDKQQPIEGVEIFVDGKSCGVTDRQGSITINLSKKPAELQFLYRDWVVTWGEVDPNSRAFGAGLETPVNMGPDTKSQTPR